MLHKLKTVLYHGTISEITAIDVSIGKSHKDFGRGFYMATTKQQAIGMMHKKYREHIRRRPAESTTENLYEISLDEAVLSKLNIKVFYEADLEWLKFILMCRRQNGVPHDFDLVVGPTADDDTAFCLKVFSEGAYGNPDSEEAQRILLRNLETDNLGIQYFIGKQEIADKVIKNIRKISWR